MGRKANTTTTASAVEGALRIRLAEVEKANRYMTEQLAKMAGDERGVAAAFDVVCKALSAERAKVAVLTAQNDQLQGRVHSLLPKPVVTTAPTATKRAYKRRAPAAPVVNRTYKRRAKTGATRRQART